MGSYSAPPSSSQPGGYRGQEDEDFHVVSTRPQPPVAVRRPPNQSVLFFALGGGLALVVVAVILALIILATPPQLSSEQSGTGTPVPTLQVVNTAVATPNWPTSIAACADLLTATPVAKVDPQRLGRAYYACGLLHVRPESPDVATAQSFFAQANVLLPGNADVIKQLVWAAKYQEAKQTLNKPDMGGYIDQLKWFIEQPEFKDHPYADTHTLLYNAYIDSGNGYRSTNDCGLAKNRYLDATKLKVSDMSKAQQLYDETVATCKEDPSP